MSRNVNRLLSSCSECAGDQVCWTQDGNFRQVDAYGCSSTVKCLCCSGYSLVVALPTLHARIHLSDFGLKRGNAPHQRPLDDFRMAEQLVKCLVFDRWPSPATIVDFGIDSSSHLGALQAVVHAGCTAYDLDRVMGDGPAITQLIRAVPDQPYPFVEFRTVYDGYTPFVDDEENL
jgi:hypothetical protein